MPSTTTYPATNHDLEPGEIFAAGKAFGQVSAGDYDALLIPDLPAFCATIVEEFAAR